MFVDETGNPDLTDLTQPFTLTGVIFEYKYAVNMNGTDSILKKELDIFKTECFGNDNLHLHLVDISHGKKEFKSFSKDELKGFYSKLPAFLSRLQFTIVSITIDKAKLKTYYDPSKDPYVVAFTHVLQNFYSFLNKKKAESGRIIIESRDDTSNLKVQKAFFDVFNNGTTHLNIEDKLRNKIKGFTISKKNDCEYNSGLEIADILCNPLGRARRGLVEADPKCMKRGEYDSSNPIFTSIKSNIYSATEENDFRNWGFKKVPVTKRSRPWIDSPEISSNN